MYIFYFLVNTIIKPILGKEVFLCQNAIIKTITAIIIATIIITTKKITITAIITNSTLVNLYKTKARTNKLIALLIYSHVLFFMHADVLFYKFPLNFHFEIAYILVLTKCLNVLA